MAKFLVECGIDSLSVNADAAKKISEVVAEAEKNLIETEAQELEEEEESSEEVEVKPAYGKLQAGESEDIEETILKELEGEDNGNNGNGDYMPSMPKGNEDVPPLNESMPVGSEMFSQRTSPEEERAVEEELVKESEKEIVENWKEKKR